MVKKVGADDFLAKFRPDDLAARVVERIKAVDAELSDRPSDNNVIRATGCVPVAQAKGLCVSAANADFELFRVFLEKTCGIVLGSNKQYLVSSRLNKLMEQQGIKSLGELVQRIQTQRGGLREDGGGRDDHQRDPVVSAIPTRSRCSSSGFFPN